MIFLRIINKPLFRFTWVLLISLSACKTEIENISVPTYVRVMDMRNYTQRQDPDNPFASYFLLSAFRLDGHYYGNPALDSVKYPQQLIDGYGDFLLGRNGSVLLSDVPTNNGILSGLTSIEFTGLLDNIGTAGRELGSNDNYNETEYVHFQPYRQGAKATGRNVYFPNLTHRVPLAPIINGIDYYKWAKFSAGSRTIGFAKVEGRIAPVSKDIFFIDRKHTFLEQPFMQDASYYFQPGGIYSLLLVSEYENDLNKTRLINIREDEKFVPDNKKAYLRFINAIPISNTATDNATESIDIYVRQVDNGELNKLRNDTINFYDPRLLTSATPEKLVVSDLKRFGQNGLLPYIELDFSEYLSKGDTTANSVLQKGVPTYIFYTYRHGESEAAGFAPLNQYKYVLTNTIPGSIDNGVILSILTDDANSSKSLPYIPVLSQTAKGFVPTITTIVLGTERDNNNNTKIFSMGYSLEQSEVRQAFLDRTNRAKK